MLFRFGRDSVIRLIPMDSILFKITAASAALGPKAASKRPLNGDLLIFRLRIDWAQLRL